MLTVQRPGLPHNSLTSYLTSSYTVNLKTQPMHTWQAQDAKARFSEFLNASRKKGPPVVTGQGVETAALVPFEGWRQMQQAARPDLKALLLGPHPVFENLIPPRRGLKHRPPLNF